MLCAPSGSAIHFAPLSASDMAYFDHFAQSQGTAVGNWITARTIDREVSFLTRLLPQVRPLEILEIGPGHGEFAQKMLSEGHHNYDVVEPNDNMRLTLTEVGVRRIKNYRIPSIAESDGSYDSIIIRDVFEHLNNSSEAQHFISEARRVLRPKGVLFIFSPDLMDWKEDFYNCDFSHSNPTTVRRVHEMFMNEDLVTVNFKYTYGCFDGAVGYMLSRVIKFMTCWTLGEDLNFRAYKLRLTFLRRFLIAGAKRA